MPTASSANNVIVKLFRVDTTTTPSTLTEFSSQTITIATVVGDQIKLPLVAELGALTLTGSNKTARDKAVTFINSAYTLVSQNKTREAITDYLSADTELDRITTPDTTGYQVRVARLMQDAGKLGCEQIALSCPTTNWGPVSYGVLVFGSGSLANSDSQGAMAIGGALSLSSYSVASRLSGDSALLAVAGSLSFTNGSVGTNGSGVIRVGGTATVSQSVSRRDLKTGVRTENFTALKNYYSQLSDKLALLPGVAAVPDGVGKYTFTGSDPVRNVFTMAGTALTAARSIVFNVPDSATVIVNVTGAAATFSNGQSFWGAQSMQDHPKSGQIFYNFPQATSISVSGFSPQGTILATRASLAHQNVSINGQVIANSLSGGGAFHCGGGFVGRLPVSNEPDE